MSVYAALEELFHRQSDMLKAWATLQMLETPPPPVNLMGKATKDAIRWHRAAATYSERCVLFHAAQDGVRRAEAREKVGA